MVLDSRRRAAPRRGGRRAQRPREAREPGPAHDQGSQGPPAGHRVLRAVARLLPLRPVSRCRHLALPGVHRRGEGRDARAVGGHLRVPGPRAAAGEGDPARRLHVPEPGAREVLRRGREARLPDRPDGEGGRRFDLRPRRSPAPGLGADHHLGAPADEPGQARRLDPAADPLHSHAPAARRRRHPARRRQELRGADPAGEAGQPQARGALRLVPPAHRPARVPARGLRRRRTPSPGLRRRQARGRDRRVPGPDDDRGGRPGS